jgi:uncharacterized protein YoxC
MPGEEKAEDVKGKIAKINEQVEKLLEVGEAVED